MSRTLISAVVLAVSLSACAKKAPAVAAPPAMSVVKDASVPPEVVSKIAENFSRVHFGYDSSALDNQSRDALSRNARLMQQHVGVMVEIQGHADERGTIDYNIALGDRRAYAVRDFLVLQGVSASRLKTVSYGEERPLRTGHNETVWSENRRAEFRVISGDPQVAGTVN